MYLLEVLESTNVCIQLNSETILSAQSVSRPLDYCGALMCLLLSCAQARIKGSLKVFFYDTEAGVTQVEQVFARPRALAKSPYMLEVRLCMRQQIGLPESHFQCMLVCHQGQMYDWKICCYQMQISLACNVLSVAV